MAGINDLPRETLHSVISYLTRDYGDLLNCSLVCWSWWDVATAALYHNVNLRHGRDSDTESINEHTSRKQMILLRSLAENPKLAAHVRNFENENDYYKLDVVSKPNTEESLIVAAARNMKNLRAAILIPNPLSAQIIANLQEYPYLTDLEIDGLDPEKHIWSNQPMSLRNLKWKIGTNRNIGSWDATQFLIKVVETTCPYLASLEINTSSTIRNSDAYPLILQITSPEIRSYYDEMPNRPLKFLYHFAYLHQYGPTSANLIQSGCLEFISRHSSSLTSIAISLPESYQQIGTNWSGTTSWSKEALDYVLRTCDMLPELKQLRINCLDGVFTEGISATEFFHALTENNIICNVENLSISDIQTHFSPEIGQILHSWPNLRILRLGDADNSNGPFEDDGRLNFEAYAPSIQDFIQSLPSTIEEIYLEINAPHLGCDEYDDFDPVCTLDPVIFTSNPRLRICDIHAWIEARGGGQGLIPDKGVFYRRLPHRSTSQSGAGYQNQNQEEEEETKKEIWISRMECIYQDDERDVEKRSVIVEGEWEGKDANEVWCGGFKYDRRVNESGKQIDEPSELVWPFFEDIVGRYEGFRKQQF